MEKDREVWHEGQSIIISFSAFPNPERDSINTVYDGSEREQGRKNLNISSLGKLQENENVCSLKGVGSVMHISQLMVIATAAICISYLVIMDRDP